MKIDIGTKAKNSQPNKRPAGGPKIGQLILFLLSVVTGLQYFWNHLSTLFVWRPSFCSLLALFFLDSRKVNRFFSCFSFWQWQSNLLSGREKRTTKEENGCKSPFVWSLQLFACWVSRSSSRTTKSAFIWKYFRFSTLVWPVKESIS